MAFAASVRRDRRDRGVFGVEEDELTVVEDGGASEVGHSVGERQHRRRYARELVDDQHRGAASPPEDAARARLPGERVLGEAASAMGGHPDQQDAWGQAGAGSHIRIGTGGPEAARAPGAPPASGTRAASRPRRPASGRLLGRERQRELVRDRAAHPHVGARPGDPALRALAGDAGEGFAPTHGPRRLTLSVALRRLVVGTPQRRARRASRDHNTRTHENHLPGNPGAPELRSRARDQTPAGQPQRGAAARRAPQASRRRVARSPLSALDPSPDLAPNARGLRPLRRPQQLLRASTTRMADDPGLQQTSVAGRPGERLVARQEHRCRRPSVRARTHGPTSRKPARPPGRHDREQCRRWLQQLATACLDVYEVAAEARIYNQPRAAQCWTQHSRGEICRLRFRLH
jgi:hypothetical protein